MDDKSPIAEANAGASPAAKEGDGTGSAQQTSNTASPGKKLDVWQRLAKTRQTLANDAQSAAQLADDPEAVLRKLGLDEQLVSSFAPPQPDERFAAPAPIEPASDFADSEDSDSEHEEASEHHASEKAKASATDAVVRKPGRVGLRVL